MKHSMGNYVTRKENKAPAGCCLFPSFLLPNRYRGLFGGPHTGALCRYLTCCHAFSLQAHKTKLHLTLRTNREICNVSGCVPTLSHRWVRHGWRDMDSLHRLKGSTFRDWLQQRGLKEVFLRSWMLPSDNSSRILYHFLTYHLMKLNIYLHVSELHCKNVSTMPHK